jgi:hypothetical protein
MNSTLDIEDKESDAQSSDDELEDDEVLTDDQQGTEQRGGEENEQVDTEDEKLTGSDVEDDPHCITSNRKRYVGSSPPTL